MSSNRLDPPGPPITRRAFVGHSLLLSTVLSAVPGAAWAALRETPFFADAVAGDKLPRVADRIPAEPAIVDTTGKAGGELRMLMATPKDVRMMVVYGYARLVGLTPSLKLAPDILKAVDVEAGSVFTLHLRKGMRWSDGQPFTAEDFRYWFEDVASNRHLSQSGLPVDLLPNGEKPRFEVLDETTVRYSWSRPNPLFLPDIAGPDPLFIYCPSHYLKQFHQKYADKDQLAALVKKARVRNWAALHNKLDAMYKNDNPELPSLQPWILKTKPPAERFIFERNPYYYRVDKEGTQLPYIDRVILSLADSRIIPAKTAAGETDLQARYLSFDDYTFLRQSEDRNHFDVRLWRTGPGSQFALYPNLNTGDAVWRGLLRDLRFRRALSLAVNRHEINQVIYFGLAIEGQNTILPQSPLYRPAYRNAWARYDLGEANRLLDLVGLTQRGSDNVRLLPDGRPMELIVEYSGEEPEEPDVLELIRDSWLHIGIRLFSKPAQLTLFRRRVFSGEALMALDKGVENGLANAASSPWEFAPTSQQELEWPKWGQYYETKGRAGEAPDLPSAVQLRDLFNQWLGTASPDDQAAAWHQILQIWADEVFSIGTVGGVLQPVVVSDKLRNIPEKGIYNWDPGAFFGIYKPDQFWLEPEAGAKSAAAGTGPAAATP
ncbi:MAG TPA: ABC transporter substrate-binding protein [Stellaceae bacterium]|jgi:peptide/nickel transport system substrate-binding protein|nr:ABC transporter substrate-binding protein [Stellaceae bacterium]